MSRKDLDEKLAEARRIIEHSDMLTAEVGAAAFFLLQEVDRLRKIEDGLEALISMKKQVCQTLYEQAVIEQGKENYSKVVELINKEDVLRNEWKPLEALLDGE